MIPIVDLDLKEAEIKAVEEVLKSKFLIEGNNARMFEEKFSQFTGAKYATTVVNGTAALHLAITALGIGPGDEVITTPFTFIASSNSIIFNGAIPVFADIDEETFNISPEAIEEKITPKTKAIMPVHIFGNPCDMKAIKDIAEEHDLIIIEDCAQAHDARIDGKHVGTFGDVGCFSFYGTKNLIGGEGGAIITNNEELFEKIKSIKNHGRSPKGGYMHYYIGFNYRMTDITAAIMRVQIERAEEILSKRHRNGDLYRKLLPEIDELRIQKVLPGHQHSDYIMAPVLLSEKITVEDVIAKLKENGIASRTIYSVLSYQQPAYQNLDTWPVARAVKYPDYSKYKCENAEFIAKRHFELPMVTSLTEEQIYYIVETLKKII